MFKKIILFLISIFQIGFTFCQVRIIGGTPVVPNEFPFMAGLCDRGQAAIVDGQFCGGTLIKPDWVLTAAHCMEGQTKNSLDAFFKTIYLTHPQTGFERIQVDSIIVHPLFDSATVDNDLALLHLKVNSTASLILLPAQNDTSYINPGNPMTVAGWGATQLTPEVYPDTMQKVTVNAVSTAVCNDPNSYDGGITNNMFCAGVTGGGKDGCYGDSGGPIFKSVGNNFVQAGIVSWGNECAQPNFPGVYTKLTNYINWIKSKVGALSTSIENINNLEWKFIFAHNRAEFFIKENEPISVKVFALSGQEIAHSSYEKYVQIDLSNVPAGEYIIHATCHNSTITKKVIKE